MRIILYLTKHETFLYNIDVFEENVIANEIKDPWSAYFAIPKLLFQNKE